MSLFEIARLLGDNECADPPGTLARLGDSGNDEDLTDATVGDEGFGAVQHVVGAFANRG